MRNSILTVIVLVGGALTAGRALATSFGVLTLEPGVVRTVDVAPSAGVIRVCNDYFGSRKVRATISDNPSRDLSPGECMEGTGSSLKIQNLGSSAASVEYRTRLTSGHR
jgi:hypothetical protein